MAIAKSKISKPVMEWHERLETAERVKKDYRELYRWDRYVDEYKGFWDLPTNEIPVFNFVFSWLKTVVASLYIRDPHIEVTPLKKTTIEQAELKELALADIWRRKRVKRDMKKCIMDAKLVSHSWMKVGYAGDFETMVDAEGNKFDTIKNDDFFIYRIPWTHVLFDNHRSIDAPYDCEWIAHEFWIPEDEFQDKKEFKFKDKVNAQTLRRFSPTTESSRRIKLIRPPELQKLSNQKFVQLFEIWDKKDRKVRILAPGVNQGFIHEKDWPYEKLQEFPFSYLNFNPINDEPYGIPDVYTFERQLLELMKVDFSILDHVKKNNRQLITEPGNLSEESRVAFEEGQTGVLLEAKNPQAIFTVPYPTAQQDIYALRNFLLQNINNTNGQPAQQRGASQPVATRTFRELNLINEESKNRQAEQLDILEDFVEDIARKISLLIDEFADESFFVKVIGQLTPEMEQAIAGRPSTQQPDAQTTLRGGRVQGFTTAREDFGGMDSQFDIEVKSGSTIPLTRENKTEIYRFAIENGTAAGAIPGGPLLGTAAKMLFREFDLKELELALEEELQAQQQQQQLQNQTVQQQQSLDAAEKGADIQIQAEREADRKEQTRLKEITLDIERQALKIKELEVLLKAQQNRDGFRERQRTKREGTK